MPIVGDIKNLYSDVEKTRALFPTTKVEAVSDEDGTGLNVILDKMAYVGHGADQVKNLYADKTETQAIFPTTKVKAVSDDNGVSLNAILENMVYTGEAIDRAEQVPVNADTLDGRPASEYATKNHVAAEIAKA